MIQEIIIFIIVGLAVAYFIYKLYKKFIYKNPTKSNAPNSNCADCNVDCDVKNLNQNGTTNSKNCC